MPWDKIDLVRGGSKGGCADILGIMDVNGIVGDALEAEASQKSTSSHEDTAFSQMDSHTDSTTGGEGQVRSIVYCLTKPLILAQYILHVSIRVEFIGIRIPGRIFVNSMQVENDRGVFGDQPAIVDVVVTCRMRHR